MLTALLVISLLIIFETRLNTDSFRALIRMLGRKNENDNEKEIEPMIADSTDMAENKDIERKAENEKSKRKKQAKTKN